MLVNEVSDGTNWMASLTLIQAKQMEIADRFRQQSGNDKADQSAKASVAGVQASEGTYVPKTVQKAEDSSKAARYDPGSDPQHAFRVHIAYKAQGGGKMNPSLDETPDTAATPSTDTVQKKSGGPNGLTEDQQRVVDQLQKRDAEVRRHEQAHAAVGGMYASAPSYVYQQGPDGRRYAVGGSVQIDMSPIPNDPEATIAKMEVVRRAAMAPAEPSSADRSVAAAAAAAQAKAMADLNARRAEQSVTTTDLRL